MFIIVLIIYVLLFLSEQYPMYKEGLKKDFFVSSILGILSLAIAILISLKINIPSPSKAIGNLIKLIMGVV